MRRRVELLETSPRQPIADPLCDKTQSYFVRVARVRSSRSLMKLIEFTIGIQRRPRNDKPPTHLDHSREFGQNGG